MIIVKFIFITHTLRVPFVAQYPFAACSGHITSAGSFQMQRTSATQIYSMKLLRNCKEN